MKNVALLSTSYSGSTLVSMLVCSHPNIIGFGDTYNYQFVPLAETSCTCGAAPSICCPIRMDIERRLNENGLRFSWLTSNPTPLPRFLAPHAFASNLSRKAALLKLYRAVPVQARLKIFPRFYEETLHFFEALDSIGNKTHYFDGCKVLLRVELLRTFAPETKVIHLIKNPKAYLYSYLGRRGKTLRSVVNGWIRYHKASREFQNILGDQNYMLVTFEELTANPEQTMEEIYQFIGVPARTEPFETWVDKSTIHVVGSESKNVFQRVEKKAPKWKTELRPEQMAYIDRKTKDIDWLQPLLARPDWS